MAAGNSTKVVLAALFANLGIAIVKSVAAAVTGSGAMLAESIHSLADSGNQGLLLLGQHRARRPPDAKHPFGYSSERYFWAFIVALVLFALGSLFSLYEGVSKLFHPEPLESVGWAYGVLVAGLAIESISFRIAAREVEKARGSRGFWTYFFESKGPALPLVYLEDLGALLGLLLALAGVTLSHQLGWILADGAATVAIGLLLGAIAVILLLRCHRLLIGEAASTEDAARILAAARAVPGVEEVLDLKTLQFGPDHLIVALEIKMTSAARTADAIEEAVRAVVPAAKSIAIEPA